jgi:transposase-like protein
MKPHHGPAHDAPLLSELLTEVGGQALKDLLREVARDALQGLIEEELTAAIGAARHERTEDPHRPAQRRS